MNTKKEGNPPNLILKENHSGIKTEFSYQRQENVWIKYLPLQQI